MVAGNPKLGYAWTLVGLGVTFAILTVTMLLADRIARIVGMNTLKAFSKLVMVLLAAIAVNFIRTGIVQTIHGS